MSPGSDIIEAPSWNHYFQDLMGVIPQSLHYSFLKRKMSWKKILNFENRFGKFMYPNFERNPNDLIIADVSNAREGEFQSYFNSSMALELISMPQRIDDGSFDHICTVVMYGRQEHLTIACGYMRRYMRTEKYVPISLVTSWNTPAAQQFQPDESRNVDNSLHSHLFKSQ